MLTFDPDKRITIQGALQHEYMKELHFPEDEPTRSKLDLFDFEFEKYDLTGE
jgi:serine/threonine protein kinase